MSFSVKYLSSLALAFLNQAFQETLEDIRNSKFAIQLHLKSADDLRMWVSQHWKTCMKVMHWSWTFSLGFCKAMPVLLMELRMTNPLKFSVLSLFIGQFSVSCSCINVVSLIFSRIIFNFIFYFWWKPHFRVNQRVGRNRHASQMHSDANNSNKC